MKLYTYEIVEAVEGFAGVNQRPVFQAEVRDDRRGEFQEMANRLSREQGKNFRLVVKSREV
jgi:hypothetical protein